MPTFVDNTQTWFNIVHNFEAMCMFFRNQSLYLKMIIDSPKLPINGLQIGRQLWYMLLHKKACSRNANFITPNKINTA